MRHMLRHHLPGYLAEAMGLGLFMASAGGFATLLWHPGLPVHSYLGSELLRLTLMGAAMGLTAIAIIYSPIGRRSGAHLNPAVTLTLLRLRKIAPGDALFYVLAQFGGGALGLWFTALLFRQWLSAPPLWQVPTVPGEAGPWIALVVEAVMSGMLIAMALFTAESARLAKFTGLFAGLLLLVYIVLAAPISGMSINPARSVASAVASGNWTAIWIYFVGPIGGMLLVGEIFRHTLLRPAGRQCVGFNQQADEECVFHCGEAYWQNSACEQPTSAVSLGKA